MLGLSEAKVSMLIYLNQGRFLIPALYHSECKSWIENFVSVNLFISIVVKPKAKTQALIQYCHAPNQRMLKQDTKSLVLDLNSLALDKKNGIMIPKVLHNKNQNH